MYIENAIEFLNCTLTYIRTTCFCAAPFHLPFRGVQLRDAPVPFERLGQKDYRSVRAIRRGAGCRLF